MRYSDELEVAQTWEVQLGPRGCSVVVSGLGTSVARVTAGADGEALANARLIAAAPELYVALFNLRLAVDKRDPSAQVESATAVLNKVVGPDAPHL